LTSKIDLFLDGRVTYVNSDKLDAFVAGTSKAEYYTYNAIGFNYKFKDKWIRPEDQLLDEIAKIDSILDGFNDADADGVMDRYDQDNATPEGAIVDGGGNAMDTDGDGVADYLDQERLSVCTEVDENGVALDSDGDNVPDCKDSEPDSPEGAQVDVTGKQINALGSAAPAEGDNSGADVGLPSVYFTLNSTKISYTNYPSLTEVAKFLKNNPGTKLAIVGHTDSTGPKDYNEELGKKRSQAVIDHLVKIYGIDAARLSASSKGNSEILAKGQDNVNRRVDFLLSK
jgi:OOP family OmpA-OmpF porin